MTIIANTTFAEEIKRDRLKLLNYAVMGMSIIIAIILLAFGSLSNTGSSLTTPLTIASIIMLSGSLVSNYLITRVSFNIPAWVFIISLMLAMGFIMSQIGSGSVRLIPYVFPLIVFIGGLLLAPLHSVGLATISMIIIIGAPLLHSEVSGVTSTQFFSIFLTILAASLAAIVTGELYQVTQWALDNYGRERRTNEELFEKRQALQISLKRAEILGEKLQNTNQDLEIANREAEEAKHFRGQFLANMSHELRTPLNAIIGFSETMLQFPIMYNDQSLPPAYEQDLNQIYNSGRQLLHVINDILDLAKVDAGKLEIHPQKVQPLNIINAVMSTAKGLLGTKPVQLEANLPDPMPAVWADETRLRQVLLNLYSNACKYTDEGLIKLTVVHLEASNEIQFALSDTGVGIDPAFHDALFEEFQQVKSGGRDPRAGSGLGLAISRQLLELMDGRIWMESTQGEGSTFYFTVQAYANQTAEPSKTDTLARAQSQEVIRQ